MATRRTGFLGPLEVPLGLGLLPLSTEGRPTADEALCIIHFALAQGIRVFDAASVDCRNEDDLHRAEGLIRQALEKWSGPKDEVKILTTVLITRPSGRGASGSRLDQLRRSVDESLLALGVDCLFLLQLQARDLRREGTLAAVAELQLGGKVQHLGLCNATAGELHQAQQYFQVASVRNELSVLHRNSAADGLLTITQEQDIAFLAERPLGGPTRAARLARNPILGPLSQRHQASPQEMALAALLDAAPNIVPLVAAGCMDDVRSSLGAARISLDVSDRTALALGMSFAPEPEALAAARQLFVKVQPSREEGSKKKQKPLVVKTAFSIAPSSWARARPCFGLAPTPEVVILMGIHGAGKSFLAEEYEGRGYVRLDRDRQGMGHQAARLHRTLAARHKLVVIESTFPTRLSRAPLIAAAHSHGLPIRCTHLQIALADAQFNIVLRMVERYGRLLDPEEIKPCRRTDPALPTPAALRRWLRSYEQPAIDEGFAAVDAIPFVRRLNRAHKQKGILLDADGTLRRSKSGAVYPCHPDDVELLPGRFETLLRWVAHGYHLFLAVNQSGIAEGKLTREMADATLRRTAELLRLPVTEIACCPHQAHPVVCWCRKPLPGLGVDLMQRHRLAAKELIVVGDPANDAEFAAALGAKFWDARHFFGWSGP